MGSDCGWPLSRIERFTLHMQVCFEGKRQRGTVLKFDGANKHSDLSLNWRLVSRSYSKIQSQRVEDNEQVVVNLLGGICWSFQCSRYIRRVCDVKETLYL